MNEINRKVKNKNLLVLSIARLLHGFGVNMFSVIYQPFLLELTNSLFITGILISIGSIMQFLPMPLVGKLSDRYGRKNTILTSIPLYIVGLLLLIISEINSFIVIILGIILYYLGYTVNQLNNQFLVAENTDKSKGLIYSFMFFSYFIGGIVGNIFVIMGQDINSRFYIFIFIIILGIEGLLFGFLLNMQFQKDKIMHHPNKEMNPQKEEKLFLKFIKDKKMRAILIFFSLDLLVYGTSLAIYNGGLVNYYGLTKEALALIVIWLNITNMIFQLPAGHLTDKIGKKKSLIISEIFGLGFFIINILTAILWSQGLISNVIPLLIVSHILFAFSIITFIPSQQIILTDLGEKKKAESYGLVEFFRGLGFIPTGVIGALLVEKINYLAPFVLTSIGIIIEIWILLKYFHD